MPGMNRKGAGGAGTMTGKGSGKCRQSGDVAGQGQGGCRRQQDGSQGQGRGGGRKGSQSVAGGMASGFPVAGYKAETQRIEQKTDPNQQALDEIMEAVRQMEMQSKGKM